MEKGIFYFFWIALGRTVMGFVFGLLLAVLVGWSGMVLNTLIGFPWSLTVHQNIQMVAIGLGGGLGPYLAWTNWTLRRHWMVGNLVLVLAAGTAGAYLGRAYGPGVDATYWWSRFAVDPTIYLIAAIGGLAVATLIGLGSKFLITGLTGVPKWGDVGHDASA